MFEVDFIWDADFVVGGIELLVKRLGSNCVSRKILW